MWSFLRSSASSPSYQEIRACGQELTGKILNATNPLGFDILQAARRMTLAVTGRTLVFDGETDMYALFDFYLHEFRVAGKTMVECCDPERSGFTALETELLCGHQRSRTSLFQAVAVRLATEQVELRDLLEPERPPVCLTDIGLSSSLQQFGTALIFIRIVEVYEITMTSGFNFVFHPDDAERLLQSFRHKMKKVPSPDWNERKFVFFYRKNREMGEPQGYVDVASAGAAG